LRKTIPQSPFLHQDRTGKVHITLTNADPHQEIEIRIELRGSQSGKVTGTVLTAKDLSAHNTFDNPGKIKPELFSGAELNRNVLTLKLPAASVVMIELN
jgi:alpha-N-arabinofuranosidase